MNICRIATVPFFVVNHLRDQIIYTINKGHKVFVISSYGKDIELFCKEIGARYYALPIKRSISPYQDLKVLFALIKFLKKQQIDIIHSVTPKAGLLSAIAAKILNIPIRLHSFTGQRWAELQGPVRWIAKFCDKIIINLNTKCYADSHSQVNYMVKQRVCKKGKVHVIGIGSLSGVNLKRFDKNTWAPYYKKIRYELNIPLSSKIIVFVGRVTKDKGIIELVEAFSMILKETHDVHLLLVGPLEQELNPLPNNILKEIDKNKNIHMIGYKRVPEKYLSVSDLFVIPSYREGFGNVVLEAAAMGLPAIGTKISGLVDSILHNKTGILVPPKNINALYNTILYLLTNNNKLLEMGNCAKKRVEKKFDEQFINELMIQEYKKLSE